jgi:hypothetical protein
VEISQLVSDAFGHGVAIVLGQQASSQLFGFGLQVGMGPAGARSGRRPARLALASTAAGAGMVSLIGHAHDAAAPAGTSWRLAGAVAAGLVALVVTGRAPVDAERLVLVFHPLRLALFAGAAAARLVGWARPAPWLLVLLLVAILAAVWFFAVSRFPRADAWGEP